MCRMMNAALRMCPPQSHFYLYALSGNKKRHARRRRLAFVIWSLFASILVVPKAWRRSAANSENSDLSMLRRPGAPPSFLSFDMGGSGLKLLPLVVRNDCQEAMAVGEEYMLGYIPLEEDPVDWLQRKVAERFPSLKSVSDWPDFAMSGSWDSFKFYGPSKDEAMLAMEKSGILQPMCEEGYSKEDPPGCEMFRPPAEIFGFIQKSERDAHVLRSPRYKGFFSDVKTQFEGARAKLEQLAGDERTAHELGQSTNDSGRSATMYPFVSWGFGTGQTIAWVAQSRDGAETWPGHMYSPWANRTASERPAILDSSTVARALTLHRKNESDGLFPTYMIKVKIPGKTQASLRNKNMDFLESVGEEMHFYSIMHGNNWKVKKIRHDLQEIYRSFFQHQVIGAINDGVLPKPHAMVFSGGLENFARISDLVRDILLEQNITSISANPDGVHCGVVRLSYPNNAVACNF